MEEILKRIAAITAILSMLLLSGCATLIKGAKQNVDMNSSPVKAQVYIDGKLMGETPLQLKLSVKNDYVVEFRAEGYKTHVCHINNKIGAGWIVLDVITGLAPVVVDAVTGAWSKLDQKKIDAVLIAQQ